MITPKFLQRALGNDISTVGTTGRVLCERALGNDINTVGTTGRVLCLIRNYDNFFLNFHFHAASNTKGLRKEDQPV